MAQKPYEWVAQYYDLMFGSGRAPMDRARERVLGRILPRVASACELACGTGTTALALARQAIKMYAVDLSPWMCRLTREKARRAGLPLRVIRSDMRAFRLPEAVDLITCEFDALNHIPRKADLGTVAKSVARALRPGGHFYFDVNNRSGFARYWAGTFWMERPDVIMVMRSGNDAERDKAWSDVELFIQEGKLWRRRQEHVDEVCWSASEIERTLDKAGFDSVRAWDAAPFFNDGLILPGNRTVYLARKASA